MAKRTVKKAKTRKKRTPTVHRYGVVVGVQCACGWRGNRSMHISARSKAQAEQMAGVADTYHHVGCWQFVAVKRVKGSHRM